MWWPFGGTCRSAARLDNKTAVVTGANTGIGKETAYELASRGARVVMAVRDMARGNAAALEIRRRLAQNDSAKGPRGEVRVVSLDLASLRSVRECARTILEQEKHVHILINNAGVAQYRLALTEDGFDIHFGVNYLGHFLLTVLLLPRMRASTAASASAPARIVSLTSLAYFFVPIDFDELRGKLHNRWLSYSRSKLAVLLFTRELARRSKEAASGHVTSYCVHPGMVSTEMFRHAETALLTAVVSTLRLFMKSPRQGAQTSLHCAVDEKAGSESGQFYLNCSATPVFPVGKDDEAARQLWDVSLELLGLKGYDPMTAAEAPAWAFQQPAPATAAS